jgi:vacuolar protein sorting-associated protein VTA1
VRIARALKEGKDPNESNPKPEPSPEENLPALDPNDPEVQQLGGQSKPQPASVEEVPDEQDRVEARLARQSSIDQSLHPSEQVSARGSPGAAPAFEPYPRDGFPYTAVQDDNVSPLEQSPHDRTGSVGGGYFPEVPTFTSESRDSTLPTAPPHDIIDLGLPDQPSAPPGSRPAPGDFESFPPPTIPDEPHLPPPPQDFYHQAPPPIHPPPPQHPTYHSPPTSHPPPTQQHLYQAPPTYPQQPTFQPPPQPYQPPQQKYIPPPAPVQAPPASRNTPLNTDDMAIAKAQKHARWAISALNFEDAETAVKELRAALQTLGAQP